jgi:hypothetical protein
MDNYVLAGVRDHCAACPVLSAVLDPRSSAAMHTPVRGIANQEPYCRLGIGDFQAGGTTYSA